MDKPGLPEWSLSAAVRLKPMYSVLPFLYKGDLCTAKVASGDYPVHNHGTVHHTHGIHCRSYLYKRDEYQAVGLQQKQIQYTGNNLCPVHILLVYSQCYLLFSYPSADTGMALLVHRTPDFQLCHRILLWSLYHGCLLHIQDIHQNKGVCTGEADAYQVREP